MATLLVLTRDPRLRARLRQAWAAHHRVLELTEWPERPGLLVLRRAHLLVLDTAPAMDIDLSSTLDWIRRRHADLSTLAVVDAHRAARASFRLGRSGVDGVVIAGRTGGALTLRQAADQALARALGRRVARRLDGRCAPLLVRCMARAAVGAADGLDTRDLAEPEGLSVGSLRRRLRRDGLPPPTRILLWGRLLAAADMLERDGGSVERTGHRLGYSSGAALSRALRHGTGRSPTTLRDRGGLVCALEAFLGREPTGDPTASTPAPSPD